MLKSSNFQERIQASIRVFLDTKDGVTIIQIYNMVESVLITFHYYVFDSSDLILAINNWKPMVSHLEFHLDKLFIAEMKFESLDAQFDDLDRAQHIWCAQVIHCGNPIFKFHMNYLRREQNLWFGLWYRRFVIELRSHSSVMFYYL